jgi:hypothetical protein
MTDSALTPDRLLAASGPTKNKRVTTRRVHAEEIASVVASIQAPQKPLFREQWIQWFLDNNPKDQHHALKFAIHYFKKTAASKIRRRLLEAPALQNAVNQHLSRFHNEFPARRESRLAELGIERVPDQVTQKTLKEFMSHGDHRLNPLVLEGIVVHLCQHEFLPTEGHGVEPGISRAGDLLEALNRFFQVSELTRDGLSRQMPGNYFVYRRSMHWPGHYLKGWLRIWLDTEATGALTSRIVLRTQEIQRHLGQDGSAPASEEYIGVLSKKSGYPFMLSCQTTIGRPRTAPRFTLIHSVICDGQTDSAVSLTGVTVSPYGDGSVWTSPVCMERTEAKAPSSGELGLFSKDDVEPTRHSCHIPLSVQARLERLVTPSVFA